MAGAVEHENAVDNAPVAAHQVVGLGLGCGQLLGRHLGPRRRIGHQPLPSAQVLAVECLFEAFLEQKDLGKFFRLFAVVGAFDIGKRSPQGQRGVEAGQPLPSRRGHHRPEDGPRSLGLEFRLGQEFGRDPGRIKLPDVAQPGDHQVFFHRLRSQSEGLAPAGNAVGRGGRLTQQANNPLQSYIARFEIDRRAPHLKKLVERGSVRPNGQRISGGGPDRGLFMPESGDDDLEGLGPANAGQRP